MNTHKQNISAGVLFVACLSLTLWLAVVPTGVLAADSGAVAGVVSDDAGKPLRGAAVTARIDNISVSRYTDASGKYLITGLKPGTYKISAAAYAFGSKTVDKDISTSTADVAFSLKPNWNPTQISSAEYISAFGNDKDAINSFMQKGQEILAASSIFDVRFDESMKIEEVLVQTASMTRYAEAYGDFTILDS